MNNMTWHERATIPKICDFYWIRCGNSEIELAYWNSRDFISGDSAGDREGLHTKFMVDWTHWADCEPPEFPTPEDTRDPIFLECPSPMSKKSEDLFREYAQNQLRGRKIVVLSGGVKLANQQEFRPETVNIECGNITIKSGHGTLMGGSVVLDGKELERVQKVCVEMDCHDTPTVQIQFAPLFEAENNAADLPNRS